MGQTVVSVPFFFTALLTLSIHEAKKRTCATISKQFTKFASTSKCQNNFWLKRSFSFANELVFQLCLYQLYQNCTSVQVTSFSSRRNFSPTESQSNAWAHSPPALLYPGSLRAFWKSARPAGWCVPSRVRGFRAGKTSRYRCVPRRNYAARCAPS